jgi:hypothetical protein
MIGSIADRLTPPLIGPLAASKHALLALTEALRLELWLSGQGPALATTCTAKRQERHGSQHLE